MTQLQNPLKRRLQYGLRSTCREIEAEFPSVNAWDRSQTSLTIMSSPGRAESKSQNSPLWPRFFPCSTLGAVRQCVNFFQLPLCRAHSTWAVSPSRGSIATKTQPGSGTGIGVFPWAPRALLGHYTGHQGTKPEGINLCESWDRPTGRTEGF